MFDQRPLQPIHAVDEVIRRRIVIRKIVDDAGVQQVLDRAAQVLVVEYVESLIKEGHDLIRPDGFAGAHSNDLFH